MRGVAVVALLGVLTGCTTLERIGSWVALIAVLGAVLVYGWRALRDGAAEVEAKTPEQREQQIKDEGW